METVNVRMIDRVPATASAVVLTLAPVPFARRVRPGQFVMVRIPGRTDPLLARPYSVYDAEKNFIRLLVKVVGKGSALLAGLEPGSSIQLTGPLGNGFRVRRTGPVVMVAGGCGAAPFLLLARKYAGRKKTLCFGASTAVECIGAEAFERFGTKLLYLTEDGSMGEKGFVTAPLGRLLDEAGGDVTVLGCGPEPMLREVSRIAAARSLDAELSLEARMACGFGVCQGCAVKVRYRNGYRYKLVCKDGPVFAASELLLDGAPPGAGLESTRKGSSCDDG